LHTTHSQVASAATHCVCWNGATVHVCGCTGTKVNTVISYFIYMHAACCLTVTALSQCNYYYYARLTSFFQDNLDKLAPER